MKKSIVELSKFETISVAGGDHGENSKEDNNHLTNKQLIYASIGMVIAMVGVYFVIDPIINRIAGAR